MSDPQNSGAPEPERPTAPESAGPAADGPSGAPPAPPLPAGQPPADQTPYGYAAPPQYAYTAPTAEPPPRGVRRLLLLVASALGAFVACSALALALVALTTPTIRNQIPFLAARAGSGPPPEAPNKFVDPPSGPVAITDDFANASRRWDRSQTRITGGAYELSLDLDNFDSYGLYLGGDGVADFDMTVDATQTAGPANGEYGIRFRQSAPDDHLMFSISSSGYFRLLRVRDKTYSSEVPWTRHEAIQLGSGATNRLRLVADGQEITGYINGMQVLSYTDPEPQAGQLTLGLVTFDQGGLAVRFDNVEGFALAGLADQSARLDLAEDFSDPETAQWSVGGAAVEGGAYEVFVAGSVVSWQQPLPTGSSEVDGDFVLEVDATMLSGTAEGSAYGVMFADDGAFDFLALMVVPQGGLMFYRNGPGGGYIIPPVEVAAVNPGLDATNRIRIETRGQTLTVTINDEVLPELELPPDLRLTGMAGLILQGADAEGVRARFDNFRLEELN